MCDNSIMPENINNLPSLAREVFPDEREAFRGSKTQERALHVT